MKKELTIHFIFLASVMIIVSIIRKWIDFAYWPLWIGGIFGTLLPDIDHFLYFYLLNPQELTSQRINYLLLSKKYLKMFDLMAQTRSERGNLIFHSAYFQVILMILTYYVISSTGSLIGKGIVIGFSLHLLVDQLYDFMEIGNLNNWFVKINIQLNKNKYLVYLAVSIFIYSLIVLFV